ncbi:SDH family Clp fold serine proteinase [Metallosphaera javensis (ex Sakai et al. 2022)]|uniref:SDH family Clp fold serine proteinase n=1 Tax=Metallosphaera javensis (ex Sakai et al. 2022) TaxID=2775498 RepID=UPI002586D908|nr:MAG: serine protease [Metallosphaera javensis (ex Sakai et al. 2022)]
MPAWGEVLQIILSQVKQDTSIVDKIRRDYLRELSKYTGRPTILYATRWMDYPIVNPVETQVLWGDKEGFMETVYGIKGDQLDLILHSPGGLTEAAKSIVEYLRDKFKSIRVIVPDAAMSAATMIALSGDVVIMGRQSNLGPIDPQFIIPLLNTQISISAQSLLEEFERAKDEVKKDKNNLLVWATKLQQYPPGILEEAKNALELTKEVGKRWLTSYMFQGEQDGEKKAERIVTYLADHNALKSHGNPVPRAKLEELGLKIMRLEDDQKLQDLVLSVYHVTRITFQLSVSPHKIIENSNGRSFIKVVAAPTPQQQRG